MFTIDAEIKDLHVKERNMAKAFFSMNNHQVATPEMMSEEARSYIIFFREADGKISAYIGIHLLLTGRKLFYSHTSNPFPERDLSSVEEEARSFAEGLGAMIDEVDLATMSHEAREQWIDSQDIFNAEREKTATPATSAIPGEGPAVSEAYMSAQQQRVQPPPQVQSVEQHTPSQHVPGSAVPRSTQSQPEAAPLTPSIPTSSQDERDQPQSVLQHITEERNVPDAHTKQPVAAAQESSSRRQADKTANGAHTGKEARESPEPASTIVVPASTSPKERLTTIQKAIKAGIVRSAKPMVKKDVHAATGVVSRDREALARLLASF